MQQRHNFWKRQIDLSKKGNTCEKLTKPTFEPPYKFELIQASNVQNDVYKNAGTGKLAVIKYNQSPELAKRLGHKNKAKFLYFYKIRR